MELPVSGMGVQFRVPDGNDDLAILEVAGESVEQALTILPRLARLETHDGAGVDSSRDRRTQWKDLTVTDFETALLGLRRFLLGDKVGCIIRPASHKCRVPLELEFSISSLLAEVKPVMPRRVEQCPSHKGWFRFVEQNEDQVRFRLPSVQDQAQVFGHPNPENHLTRRCIQAANLNSRITRRVERVMEVMAPTVSRPLIGRCGGCGESLTMALHVPRFVVDELRIAAGGIHEDVHAIASTYHWDEASILAMPQGRRQAYAATTRRQARETL